MKIDLKYSAILIVSLLLLIGAYFTYSYFKLKQEKKQLEWSLTAGNMAIKYVTALNGDLIAKVEAQTITVKELKAGIIKGVLDEIENMNIKPKNVYNYSETVIQHDKEIVTALHDSIVNDTITAMVFDYADEFYNVSGLSINNTQYVSINSIDSLIQVVHKGDRITRNGTVMPGWWIFTPRRMEQSITSKNPASKILFSKFIQINKK